jgi:hypothetical protein
MKQLIFALLMATTMISFGQNGGQYPENGSVKLEYVGHGQVKVTNKQTCTAVIRLNDSKTVSDLTVNGNSYVLYQLPADLTVGVDIKAKTTTNCGGTDFGQVELFIANVMAVTFTKFSVDLVSGNTYSVNFDIANPSNVKAYNIQVSTDNKTWHTMTTLPHDPNKYHYSTNVILLNK